jgi:hypothetical protein
MRGRHWPAKNLSKTQKNLTDESSSQHTTIYAPFIIDHPFCAYFLLLANRAILHFRFSSIFAGFVTRNFIEKDLIFYFLSIDFATAMKYKQHNLLACFGEKFCVCYASHIPLDKAWYGFYMCCIANVCDYFGV